jgi:hypothetical protein
MANNPDHWMKWLLRGVTIKLEIPHAAEEHKVPILHVPPTFIRVQLGSEMGGPPG